MFFSLDLSLSVYMNHAIDALLFIIPPAALSVSVALYRGGGEQVLEGDC